LNLCSDNRRIAKWAAAGALLACCAASFAQLPASDKLSDQDQTRFRAEVARIEKLLSSASDPAAVTYQMARTWAAGGQWPEAVQWLRKAVAFKAGLDPSRDSAFARLRGAREFDAIVSAVQAATPPVLNSRPAFVLDQADLVPENLAYDPAGRNFYFGSMRKGKVIRCSPAGACAPFAKGLGTVLGLKLHGGGLWALNNADRESALLHFDLASGRVIRRYAVEGAGHGFNDLAIAETGDVYLTDTRAGALWYLANGAAELAQVPGRFQAANGIALSPDGRLLYVSAFPDGITVVDLKAHTAAPIARPAGLCLAAVDGLYFYGGALIAIQNGFMTPRVVRLRLSRDLRTIEQGEILERRNPLFDGITTGVVADGEFYYMANIQDDRKTGFTPIQVLKLRL
jgi:hypothetical protein